MAGPELPTDPELVGLSLADLDAVAFDPRWSLRKARAMDELARRALDEPSLLARACEAIGRERTWKPRMGPPLGWLGAARLYLSGRHDAMAHLLREMDGWTANDQGDLIRHLAGPHRSGALLRELREAHGWQPKPEVAAAVPRADPLAR